MQTAYLYVSFVIILFFATIWRKTDFLNVAIKMVLMVVALIGAISIAHHHLGDVVIGSARLF